MGRPLIDLTGRRFHRLTVLSHDHVKDNKVHYWLCRCDCGSKIVVEGNKLKNGKPRLVDATGPIVGARC